MSRKSKPKNIVRTALLSIWGMITLVLVFTVSLLMYEMYQQGQSPLALTLGTENTAPLPVETPPVQVETFHEVEIYFASRTTSTLLTEPHRLTLTGSTVENCRAAMSFLIDGPNLPALAPIVSNKTRIRAMYLLENGELVIDFSRDLEAGHVRSASAELLMVDGIANTLFQPILKGKNDLGVRHIRFLFEGAAYQQTFPAHIDLTDPIRPRERVTAVTGNSGDNG
jgi:hypothetical protein